MGCWYQTCGVTQLPIRSGDRVYATIIVRNPDPMNTSRDTNATTALEASWAPLTPFFSAKYNDYGGVKEYEEGARTRFVQALVAPLLHEGREDDSDLDDFQGEVLKDPKEFSAFLNWVVQDRCFVVPEERSFCNPKVPVPIGLWMCHEFAYLHLISNYKALDTVLTVSPLLLFNMLNPFFLRESLHQRALRGSLVDLEMYGGKLYEQDEVKRRAFAESLANRLGLEGAERTQVVEAHCAMSDHFSQYSTPEDAAEIHRSLQEYAAFMGQMRILGKATNPQAHIGQNLSYREHQKLAQEILRFMEHHRQQEFLAPWQDEEEGDDEQEG